MKRYHGPVCFQRFPRASRDNPLRCEQSIYGPYTSTRVSLGKMLLDAFYWLAAVLMLLALFKAPAIWAFLFGG